MAEYGDQHLGREAEEGGGGRRHESDDLAVLVQCRVLLSSWVRKGGGVTLSQADCQLLTRSCISLVSFLRDRFLKSKVPVYKNCPTTNDHLGSICFAASSHAALH